MQYYRMSLFDFCFQTDLSEYRPKHVSRKVSRVHQRLFRANVQRSNTDLVFCDSELERSVRQSSVVVAVGLRR
jgi:hypothetical protein